MDSERDDLITLDEDVERHYHQYIPEFTEKIYETLFKKHGFTLSEAMNFWMLNKIHCQLVDIEEVLKAKFEHDL